MIKDHLNQKLILRILLTVISVFTASLIGNSFLYPQFIGKD